VLDSFEGYFTLDITPVIHTMNTDLVFMPGRKSFSGHPKQLALVMVLFSDNMGRTKMSGVKPLPVT
jgi:hypothetical protein